MSGRIPTTSADNLMTNSFNASGGQHVQIAYHKFKLNEENLLSIENHTKACMKKECNNLGAKAIAKEFYMHKME